MVLYKLGLAVKTIEYKKILPWGNEGLLMRGKRTSKSDRRKKSAILKARKRKQCGCCHRAPFSYRSYQ
jgi:hypothetical protein